MNEILHAVLVAIGTFFLGFAAGYFFWPVKALGVLMKYLNSTHYDKLSLTGKDTALDVIDWLMKRIK